MNDTEAENSESNQQVISESGEVSKGDEAVEEAKGEADDDVEVGEDDGAGDGDDAGEVDLTVTAEEEVTTAATSVTGNFEFEKCQKLMQSLTQGFSDGKSDMNDFCTMFEQLLKFLKHFGSGIGKAFNDTQEKMNAIKSNRDLLIGKLKLGTSGSDEDKYLQAFVALEKV